MSNEIEIDIIHETKTSILPALFISHGSPMNAIEDNIYTRRWKEVMDRVNDSYEYDVICVISAHWYINGLYYTDNEIPRTIHDFGGFPRQLYEQEYPVSGKIPIKIKNILDNIGIESNSNWGLDHGTWSILKHMLPNANKSVFQISINKNLSINEHYELSKKLNILRKNGVLIIGSGGIVHNVPLLIDYIMNPTKNSDFTWASRFDSIIKDAINNNDLNTILNYHELGTWVYNSVPSLEHYLPFVYIMSLKEEDENVDIIDFGQDNLYDCSMTSISIGI